MTRRILVLSILAIAAAGAFSPALAQKPVTQGAAVTETATIVAIDSTNRLITLKDKDGITDLVTALHHDPAYYDPPVAPPAPPDPGARTGRR